MKHIHDGHRDRMRDRFLKTGLSSFEKHEILELLLFYAIPRKNTNEIGHYLINKFSSIAKVFDADTKALQEIDGISKNSAIFLKMIPQVCKRYVNEEYKSLRLTDAGEIAQFAIKEFSEADHEMLKMAFLDNNCGLIACVDISKNDGNSLILDKKRIIQLSTMYHSAYMILMHNHLNGDVTPSFAEKVSVQTLNGFFRKLNLALMDSIIVSGTKTLSMRAKGCF